MYRLAASRVARDGSTTLSFNRLTDLDYALTFDPLYIQGPLRDWELQALQTINANRPYDLKQLMVATQQKMNAYLACIQSFDPTKLTTADLKADVVACATQADPEGHWN